MNSSARINRVNFVLDIPETYFFLFYFLNLMKTDFPEYFRKFSSYYHWKIGNDIEIFVSRQLNEVLLIN